MEIKFAYSMHQKVRFVFGLCLIVLALLTTVDSLAKLFGWWPSFLLRKDTPSILAIMPLSLGLPASFASAYLALGARVFFDTFTVSQSALLICNPITRERREMAMAELRWSRVPRPQFDYGAPQHRDLLGLQIGDEVAGYVYISPFLPGFDDLIGRLPRTGTVPQDTSAGGDPLVR